MDEYRLGTWVLEPPGRHWPMTVSRSAAILWDNDGVLVDTEALFFLANQTVLETVGVRLTRERFIDLSLRRGRSVLELARPASSAALDRIRDRRNARYSELLRGSVRVLDGVDDVLRRLQPRFVMGIVTTSLRDHFDEIHSATNLPSRFDFVLTREDYARAKPSPDGYLRGVERAGMPASRCLAVEDSPRGLRAARRAGIECVVVPNDLTRSLKFDGAYRVLGSVEELPEVVDEWATAAE